MLAIRRMSAAVTHDPRFLLALEISIDPRELTGHSAHHKSEACQQEVVGRCGAYVCNAEKADQGVLSRMTHLCHSHRKYPRPKARAQGSVFYGIQAKVSGFGPMRPTSPLSSASMRAISPVESAKSKMSRFSRIRSSWLDLGKIAWPCWICQRSTTWATDLPLVRAIAAITESCSTVP